MGWNGPWTLQSSQSVGLPCGGRRAVARLVFGLGGVLDGGLDFGSRGGGPREEKHRGQGVGGGY